jgi:hypothetical protein
LKNLGALLGLEAERHDTNGEGPDVLWLLPNKVGLVIEAKSRKKAPNALTKEEHGQLLVAAEWFAKQYPEFQCIRVSVHCQNKATKAAVAEAPHALKFEKLALLVSEARTLLEILCESQLPLDGLTAECAALLEKSTLSADRLPDAYLVPFEQVEKIQA